MQSISSNLLIPREVDAAAEPLVLQEIMQLRLDVWSAQVAFALTLDDVIDDFERQSRHWAVMDGNRVVAASRLSIHQTISDVSEAVCLAGVFANEPPAPIGFLSRLVVASDYRLRGLGRQLDEIRIRAVELDEASRSLHWCSTCPGARVVPN
jgi:predicted GNAT family N-acyltransferase